MGREGGEVAVPLRLTHETVGLLVGARRPSVTTALHSLAAQGSLTRVSAERWILHGVAPAPNASG